MFAMQRRLAVEEGIWVEPAGAAAVAALPRLLEQGALKPNQRVVCILSGAGFKDTHLAETEADALTRQAAIPFDLDAITAACMERR